MVRRLEMKPILSVAAAREAFLAEPATDAHYDAVVDSDCDGFDAVDGRHVFCFRKGVIAPELLARARDAYADIDERVDSPSLTRRAAAGKIDVKKFHSMRDDVVDIIQLTPTTGQLRLRDGRILRQPMSNPVRSYMAGYTFQRFKREAVPALLTRRYPERWQQATPFFQAVDRVLQRELPEVHARHRAQCQLHPGWTIPGTALSTVTINVNYESHFHYDNGDFADGYSTLSVVEVGRYSGGRLVYPRYRTAVELREGDVLLFRAHVDLHGNTAVQGEEGAKRVSFVTYLKDKLAVAVNRLDAPSEAGEWSEGRRVRASPTDALAQGDD